jgi:glycosyltransferase involved in cell wall biosynthesis
VSQAPQSVIRSATIERAIARELPKQKRQSMPPRLLFVGAYPPPSVGTPAISQAIAERLQSNGWSVTLTSRQRLRAVRFLEIHRTVLWTRNHYDVAHIDVFSGSAFRWAEGAAAILRRIGKPYVLTLHGGNLPTFAAAHSERVERLLASAAHVTAPSTYLLDTLWRDKTRSSVIPNPIDLTRYVSTPRTHATPHLIWLRAFHAIYNPHMALAVLQDLAQDYPRAHLTMVGPDKDGSFHRIEDTVRATSLTERVRLTGAVPKDAVPAMLDSANIFLNTTTIDNSPVSVLEAMASGLCVISTDVGGIRHLLTHEHDALLVPPGDAKAMATAVRRVQEEPALAARLSHNARAKAEMHSWNRVLPLWESCFSGVAPQGALRA